VPTLSSSRRRLALLATAGLALTAAPAAQAASSATGCPTGRSGALTGREFRYGPTGLTGKLVANTFPVPAIAPSTTCSLVAATLDNVLLGLPLGPGASSITYDAAFQLR